MMRDVALHRENDDATATVFVSGSGRRTAIPHQGDMFSSAFQRML